MKNMVIKRGGNMELYNRIKLEDIEKHTNKNKLVFKIMIISIVVLLLASIFFVGRYIEWYEGTTLMGYDFIDDGIDTGKNYNPFVAPKLKEIRAYDQYFNYNGRIYVDIDY